MNAIAPWWGWLSMVGFVVWVILLALAICHAAKHGDEQLAYRPEPESDWEWPSAPVTPSCTIRAHRMRYGMSALPVRRGDL